MVPSAPELPANEEEQAGADASLSRAPPPAMATAGVGGYTQLYQSVYILYIYIYIYIIYIYVRRYMILSMMISMILSMDIMKYTCLNIHIIHISCII